MSKMFFATLLSTTMFIASPAFSQDDAVIAKVNGFEIKKSDLVIAEEEVGSNAANLPADQKQEFLLNFIIDLHLASKAAEAKGLDKSPAFQKKMVYAKQKLLVEGYLDSEAKAKVTPEAIKKVYDEEIGKLKPEEEVSARHILVKTEEEAKAIQAKLKAGGDFAALAKELSTDTGSGADGGNLGFFTKDKMVKEFADVAFKTEKGKVSEIVKSQFGFHIIKVDDKRMTELPKLEAVKPQIEEYLLRKSQADLITALKANAKIEKIEGKK